LVDTISDVELINGLSGDVFLRIVQVLDFLESGFGSEMVFVRFEVDDFEEAAT
jgi:hypothetical protein